MVKRILKIVGIVLASFVVVAGASIGIAVLSGKFEEEVIPVTKIYFDDDTTNTVKTVYTLDDVVENIQFEPANATEKKLKIEVSGNQNGIIEDLPTTLTAGEDFTIKVKKDKLSNNVGGVVSIKAISSNGLAFVTLRVIVDVNIPDNSLYFTGTNSGKITTSGKSFTMPISQNTQHIYLKSTLINAFSLPVGANENLKSADISYKYYRANGELYAEENLSSDLEVKSIFNALQGKQNYYYEIPITTDIAGTIDISAKMHRTYEIQKAYEENKFDELVPLLKNALSTDSEPVKVKASATLLRYNEFLNKYIRYFDTTQESYEFFKNWIPNGSIAFSMNDVANIEKSLNYVFVTCNATVNVTAIKLDDFTSLSTPREYDVFGNNLYSVSGVGVNNITEDFALTITTDNETASGVEQEKAYLYESLTVKPYLYLSKENFKESNFIIVDDREVIVWLDRNYSYIPVYGFNEHTPLFSANSENVEPTGYLLLLTNQDEYLSVTELMVNGEKQWKISCNTPLPNDQSQASNIYKALYLGFEVSGIAEDNSTKTIQSFTRIYINYEDYDFTSNEVNTLTFNTIDSQMTINTNLGNSETLTSGLYTQDISLDTTTETIGNINDVSYTSIMYFAETTSNAVVGGSKVATVGKYKFVNFINSNKANAEISYYMYNDSQLIGERIPTYRSTKLLDAGGNAVKDARGNDVYQKQYYLHALNASTEPVKIFAVAYLSDASGNPIDINGRRLVINESDQSEDSIPELVVIRITDYTDNKMPEITINSYVDEINFYTQSLVSKQVGGIDFNAGFINRNSVNSYADLEGTAVDADSLKEIQDFLKLKLLQDNYFTLYLTTFELDGQKNIVQQANSTKSLILKDVITSSGIKEETKEYSINVMNNKQIGFNNICKDFDKYNLYIGGTGVSILPNETKVVGDGVDGEYSADGNASMIKFVLHATLETSSDIQNTIIYLDPTSSSIPYSNLLIPSPNSSNSRNNWTNYEIHKLEINNLELDEDTLYTKLFARYADNATSGELEFRVPTLSGDTLLRTDYSLALKEGNIKYTTETNLIAEDDYNLAVVDCSQAGTREDIPEDVDENSYYYSTIEDYISHYITGVNGTGISYTNPDNVMSFKETFVFNNIDQEGSYTNTIYFGTKTFNIDEIAKTVNINGYTLKLVEQAQGNDTEYKLVINQGEYFPIVAGNKALIYNELFTIFTTPDNTSKYILDYVDSNDSGTRILVDTTASLILASGETDKLYNPNTYIDDSSTQSKNSAIKVNTDGTSAKVNFLQGEEIGSFQKDSNGTYKQIIDGSKIRYEVITDSEYRGDRYAVKAVYEQNINGNLYFNNNTQEFEVITSSIHVEPEQRYAKKGVIVYLLITFNIIKTDNNSSEYTFYKALTYELVQEEIEIVGINKIEGGQSEINSSSKPLEIKAGQETTIYLNLAPKASDAKITTIASDEKYFFNHVTFSIGSTAIQGITCEENISSDGNKESIVLNIPNLVSDNSLTLNMSYKYKGKTVTKPFHIKILANVDFKPKDDNIFDNKVIDSNDYSVYSISLNSGIYQIVGNDGIIDYYFNADIGNDKLINSVALNVVTGYGNLCDINSNSLTIKSSYANYDGGQITKDFVLCDITLNLIDGTNITLATKLYIEIVPTYVVDLSQLDSNNSNNIKIFNGDDIFANYVRLFSGDISQNGIKDTNNILNNSDGKYNMFTITATGDSVGNVSIENGKIRLNNIPTIDTTVTLRISYLEGAEARYKDVAILVRGVTLKVSQSGAITDATPTPSDLTTLNGNVTLSLSDISVFDIDNYFSFALSTPDDSVEIQAVLVDSEGNFVSTPESGVSYQIGYAKTTGGNLILVETTPYTLTINQISE